MKPASLLLLALSGCVASHASTSESARWQQHARDVTITRDDWGIAHVHGKTDADAIFGMIYAQAEDDFNRIETNYLNAMGRMAEAEGDSVIFRDLRMKLFIDPDTLKARYGGSPDWLKTLMDAWADGLNYFLATHPKVTPRVLKRFEPWMALSFSEGSIGGDIEGINLRQLRAFYGDTTTGSTPSDDAQELEEPRGSNGIAIAPQNTTAHHALLLINPHTSFFFRSELAVQSDEGLNAYGAATWGQFFIYQGFNDRVGWMHTSSGVDAVDEYAETIVKHGDNLFYKYGNEERPVQVSTITIPYKTPSGLAKRSFTVYRTHHGPVVRELDGKWVTVRLMQEPVKALTQSFSRTKARDYKAFRESFELHTNSSNNTIYADADGNIAYFHANFVPRRDPRFDWSKPVDGSDPATEWKGLHSFDESPNLFNPETGWLYNSNDPPWNAAGPASRKKSDYPAYFNNNAYNARGPHAIRVLENRKDFSIAGLIGAAYDTYLTGFTALLPSLLAAYDSLPATDTLKSTLAEQIRTLRTWDLRWAVGSVPTSLAVYWGEELGRKVARAPRPTGITVDTLVPTAATSAQKLQALAAATARLTADFGSWKTPWGEINRFQRITDDIVHPFTDAGPSIPVGFPSARWGSLASFGARTWKGSKKRYGTSGNSFVAVVEFGDSVHARAVTAGGESGDPASKHFNDEAERYATGNLREVYFYKSQLRGHVEREYHPGS